MNEPKVGWYRMKDNSKLSIRYKRGQMPWLNPIRINNEDLYRVNNIHYIGDDYDGGYIAMDDYNSMLIYTGDWNDFEYAGRNIPGGCIKQGKYKLIDRAGNMGTNYKYGEMYEIFTKPNHTKGYDSYGTMIIDEDEWKYFEYVE